MSTGNKPKTTGTPKNVPEAVKHLRRQLKLSMEKFAARVGCSFQTVVRWEAGKAKINYFNLVKLAALAQEADPVTAPIFANELQTYSIGSDFHNLQASRPNEDVIAISKRLSAIRDRLDKVQSLVESGDGLNARARLRRLRRDLQLWIDEANNNQTASEGVKS